jgi:hypothetical protein
MVVLGVIGIAITLAIRRTVLYAGLDEISEATVVTSDDLACFTQQVRYRLNSRNRGHLVVALRATGSPFCGSGVLLGLKEGSLRLGLHLRGVRLALGDTRGAIASDRFLFALALRGSYTCCMLVLYEGVSRLMATAAKLRGKGHERELLVFWKHLFVSQPTQPAPTSAL